MLKRSMEKALEYSRAISEIIKAWSEAAVSLMAAITAVYTGFREIKKMKKEKVSEKVAMQKAEVGAKPELKESTSTETSSSPEPNSYYFDSNSVVFLGTSLVFVFLLARMGTRKKTESKS